MAEDTVAGEVVLDEDEWYSAKVVFPDGSKAAVNKETQPRLHQLKKCVNRQARITLSDGRVVMGTFICFDYQGNVLMNNAEEQKRGTGSNTIENRHLGMIMVKPQHLVKLETEAREGDIAFY
mmetsp:Transcript_12613/g.24497  ORF Transcript_12613/g.24497 Transcript_12613/m.24497 type:complete len:122 (+) Transcript_12613:3-368(+)